jgi:hypothetical protein
VVAPTPREYLVSHGNAGDFGRFQTAGPLTCRRGDRVVIQTRLGLELGEVLCEATPRQLRVLENVPRGQLLRLATEEDRQADQDMRARGQLLFEDGRRLAAELGLPLELLDVELSLDGLQGVVHFVGPPDSDIDPFAAVLARRHELFILMHNLALPLTEEVEAGCGDPNCGRASGQGCTTCSTGGGCATGCGGKADMRDYFAHLRAKMEKRNLTPLL